MESPLFRVERRERDGVPVLVPFGRITLGQSERQLRKCFDDLAGEGHRSAVLDLADVPYVDSAGLGTLVQGLNGFKQKGGALALVNVRARVAQLIELTQLGGAFPTYPSEAAAISALAAQG